MKCHPLLLLALSSLSTLATSSTLYRRDAATVKQDISTISTNLNRVYQDVQAFQGDTLTALAINNDANTLSNSLAKAAQDAGASAPFTTADSAAIASSIAALQPNIVATLQLLVSKKPLFQTAALGLSADGLVESSVQSLKTNTDYFAGNVSRKFVADIQNLAPLVTGQIDYHYVQTLQAFSN